MDPNQQQQQQESREASGEEDITSLEYEEAAEVAAEFAMNHGSALAEDEDGNEDANDDKVDLTQEKELSSSNNTVSYASDSEDFQSQSSTTTTPSPEMQPDVVDSPYTDSSVTPTIQRKKDHHARTAMRVLCSNSDVMSNCSNGYAAATEESDFSDSLVSPCGGGGLNSPNPAERYAEVYDDVDTSSSRDIGTGTWENWDGIRSRDRSNTATSTANYEGDLDTSHDTCTSFDDTSDTEEGTGYGTRRRGGRHHVRRKSLSLTALNGISNLLLLGGGGGGGYKKTPRTTMASVSSVSEALIEETIQKIRQPYYGIKMKDSKHGRYFKGKHAVAWVMNNMKVEKETALTILRHLQGRNFIRSLASRVTTVIDDNSYYYTFTQKKKIVIVGGGFAGSQCAKKLEKEYDVTLFDRKEYFECTLSYPNLIVSPQNLDKIRVKHTDYLKSATFMCREVTRITPTRVYYRLDPGDEAYWGGSEGSEKYVSAQKRGDGEEGEAFVTFDYLLIATGVNVKPPFPVRGSSMIVVNPYSTQSIVLTNEALVNAKTVAVIGAGPVGVEVLGEIATMYPDKRIYLVSNSEMFMDRFCKRVKKNKLVTTVHNHTIKAMSKFKNVRLLMGEQVISIQDGSLEIEKKGSVMKLDVDVTYICIGCRPNTQFAQEGFAKTKSGHLKVNKFFQVLIDDGSDANSCSTNENPETPGSEENGSRCYSNIFAMGDITDIVEEKLAQAAERHAEHVVKNIFNSERSLPMEPYLANKPYPMIVTIGPNHALLLKGDKVMMEMGMLGKVKDLAEMRVIRALKK